MNLNFNDLKTIKMAENESELNWMKITKCPATGNLFGTWRRQRRFVDWWFPVADAAVDPGHGTSVTPVAIDPTDRPLNPDATKWQLCCFFLENEERGIG